MLQSYPETGWVKLRDDQGRLWAEYHPEAKLLRRRKKLFNAIHFAYISITDLMDRKFAVNVEIDEDIRKIR